ncbi:MAG TPA: hypothetical protein PLV57_22415 [Phycisphaerae bacterium]|nr:hypothetical protein [Phycisphaerae bacterium]HOM53801.1 hypothetical protein [Phycisphaerae bacterium]HPP29267.1 hypothetical protein [Phycisphaerae bacterium]
MAAVLTGMGLTAKYSGVPFEALAQLDSETYEQIAEQAMELMRKSFEL